MWTFLARRLFQGIVALVIITILCFILTRLSGDPMAQYANKPGITPEARENIRIKLGLDKPLPIQYLRWLEQAVQGNLGDSLFNHKPVSELIGSRLPLTLILMFTAETFTVILALALGILSAVRQYSFADNLITSLSFIGYSMPIFFIALGLMLIFAVKFKAMGLPYLPTGADVWDPKNLVQLVRHMVLPVSCLVIIMTAGYARYVRSSMLEVLGQDFVRTARAKGLGNRAVLFRHALRNAALPFITIIGLDIPFLLGGALVTESIYAWPGMGRLFWEYAMKSDFPVVLGVLLIVSVAVVVFSILTDVAYTFIDPRIRIN
jgi:peptide/nickel transport system permease protein